MEMKCLRNIKIGREHDLLAGEVIDVEEFPAGAVESMIRIGVLVEVETETETEIEGEGVVPVLEDWKETSIADLDLNVNALRALAAAGLRNVHDILAYGSEHGSLIDIKGIGEESETAIKAAIEKLQK